MRREISAAGIVEAAIHLIEEKEFEEVTIQEICQRAGIAKSTFYYHFRSKEDLFSSYYCIVSDEVVQQLPTLLRGDVMSQLFGVLQCFLVTTVSRPVEVLRQFIKANLVREEGGLPQDLCESYQRLARELVALIEKAQEQSWIYNKAPPEDIFRCMSHAIYGVCVLYCAEDGRCDFLGDGMRMLRTILAPV